eukprot:1366764-Amorphochlora_amoeboformis.AAC.1
MKRTALPGDSATPHTRTRPKWRSEGHTWRDGSSGRAGGRGSWPWWWAGVATCGAGLKIGDSLEIDRVSFCWDPGVSKVYLNLPKIRKQSIETRVSPGFAGNDVLPEVFHHTMKELLHVRPLKTLLLLEECSHGKSQHFHVKLQHFHVS